MGLPRKISHLLLPIFEKYFRVEYIGLENIPNTPFLGVGNHLGVYFMPETYLWLGKYHSLNSKPPMKVLVHKMLHNIYSAIKIPEKELGILEASPKNAEKALNSGSAVTVYPGGDRENSKTFSKRNEINFYNHHGYIKLALKTGVPILPIVGIGGGETLFVLSSGEKFAEKTGLSKLFKLHSWPIYFSFPFGLHIGHLPNLSIPLPSQITLSVLPAISLEKYSSCDINDTKILDEINEIIISNMQKEMDKLTKDRIPIIGQIKKTKKENK